MKNSSLTSDYKKRAETAVDNLLDFFLKNGGDISALDGVRVGRQNRDRSGSVATLSRGETAPTESSLEETTDVHPAVRDKERVAQISREVKSVERRDISGMNFERTTFCVTGKLRDTRNKIVELIHERGGKFSASITRDVDCLVCGDKPGSKLVKARNFGIPIVTENDFFRMIEGRF